MERRLFKVRGCIAALCAILLSLCLALGLTYAAAPAVYADEGDGEGTTEGGEETVMQENEWLTEPAFVVVVGEEEVVLTEWTQGTFHGDEYVIVAEAKHGSDEMYFRIYAEGEEGLAPVEFSEGIAIPGETVYDAFKVAEDGRVPAYAAEKLTALEAGNYYLLAIVPEDSYGEYAGLNHLLSDGDTEEIIENSFAFEITAAPEVIEVTLSGVSIIEWTLGDFDVEKNIIKVETNASADDVTYTVYRDNNGEKGSAIINLTEFKTADNGMVVDSGAIEAFNLLGAGKYWLTASVTGADGKVLTETVTFSIIDPNLISDVTLSGLTIIEWQLGEFNVETNFIKVETNVPADYVTYTVYHDNGGEKGSAVINLTGFKTTESGMVVGSKIIEAFELLGAGKYYLTASVTGATCIVLTETISFNIRIQNYWVDTPSLKSWAKGQFSTKENVLRGSSRVGQATFAIYDEKDNLLYTVVKKEDGTIDTVTDADGNGGLHIKVLNKLPVGSYKIIAVVESTDKYSALETTAYFWVEDDSVALGGIIAATVVFAVVDLIAAGLCIALLIIRRRTVEAQFHKMVNKELHRR